MPSDAPQQIPGTIAQNRPNDYRPDPVRSYLRPRGACTTCEAMGESDCLSLANNAWCLPLYNVLDTIGCDVRTTSTWLDVVEEYYHGEALLSRIEEVGEPVVV